MNEPSVDFDYPDDRDPELDAARNAGRGEAWCLLVEKLAACRNPKLRIAVMRHISNPRERTVEQIARACGCSRMTVHRELRRVRKLPKLLHPFSE